MSIALGELVNPVESWSPERDAPDDSFAYIDLSAVDQDAKAIIGAREVPCAEAPSRAKQIVAAGDVLVSTVRPNLNGVARVPSDMDGATASTGFCVLRPHPEQLDGAYLFHWVRSPRFIAEMVRRATGASYPAVSDRIVLESQLPLPPVPEQRRIAEILDKADALRAERRAALAQLDTLTQSIFLDMFGDPVANPRSWPLSALCDLGTVERGVSKHRPRNAPELLGGPYPFVQTGDVANCDGYIRTYSATYSEIGLRQSRIWPAGTLCITIAANIAKTGILTFDACFPDSVVGFRSQESATVEYVRVWLSFLQESLERSAPESAQKNINLEILRALDVPTPGIDLQREFAHRLGAIERCKIAYRRAIDECNTLFGSLQHRAFRGELSFRGMHRGSG
jgi:type I restriction enzyme S subunit